MSDCNMQPLQASSSQGMELIIDRDGSYRRNCLYLQIVQLKHSYTNIIVGLRWELQEKLFIPTDSAAETFLHKYHSRAEVGVTGETVYTYR